MRLQEYWGVGPKTAERLEAELGAPAAVEAIESADVGALVDAGVPRGRATRVLRRANGGEGLALLATDDAREVYKDVLGVAESFAVTDRAADRVRVLTPLRERDPIEDRLDAVVRARETWADLGEAAREDVLATFAAYDSRGGEGPAVEAALDLLSQGRDEGVFAPLADLDADALGDAADALGHLDGGTVRPGADGTLDARREELAAVERLAGTADEVLEAVRTSGVQRTAEFREGVVEYVTGEADVSPARVREAMDADAADATEFVSATLRALAADRREAVEEREERVAADLRATVEDARADVDAAATAVDDIAFHLSLARFADRFDMTRPDLATDRDAVAVVGARNLSLAADEGESVQPVTYGVGEHGAAAHAPAERRPPSGDRVAVLTGANSGGKTTLLETLCQVALLAHLGLPVPAEHAEVSPVDALVFHRRHASFNAGVLESTLRSVVPPLAGGDRTLMLVDEFEAITEPGRAADLLHGLVTLTVDRSALGVYVTHLAGDLEPLPDEARTDGIFAEGLGPDLELAVDYQPRFDAVGKSTPEFIVSRLVADADDRAERAAFETLAEAVGQEAVQRTLADARWDGEPSPSS